MRLGKAIQYYVTSLNLIYKIYNSDNTICIIQCIIENLKILDNHESRQLQQLLFKDANVQNLVKNYANLNIVYFESILKNKNHLLKWRDIFKNTFGNNRSPLRFNKIYENESGNWRKVVCDLGRKLNNIIDENSTNMMPNLKEKLYNFIKNEFKTKYNLDIENYTSTNHGKPYWKKLCLHIKNLKLKQIDSDDDIQSIPQPPLKKQKVYNLINVNDIHKDIINIMKKLKSFIEGDLYEMIYRSRLDDKLNLISYINQMSRTNSICSYTITEKGQQLITDCNKIDKICEIKFRRFRKINQNYSCNKQLRKLPNNYYWLIIDVNTIIRVIPDKHFVIS